MPLTIRHSWVCRPPNGWSSAFFLGCLVSIVMLSSTRTLRADEPVTRAFNFDRDIRPILSDTCFQCHGPDAETRATDFRLDIKDGALADLGGYHAIVPGDVKRSDLVQRIRSTDPETRMPPPDSGRTLSARQMALLEQWIEQGAIWQEHWSFVAPNKPVQPPVKNERWIENPIDSFVLSRLEQTGLTPSAVAAKTTLLRRVTLDLTGLPPTPDEIREFLGDDTPGAYERLVERLLQSPRYGERMAVPWLDAARFADTSGYQTDGIRYMWRWRDWVIDALNQNMPFDQFTIEQLAGDLLPDPDLEQLIATGFNRNHRANSEGGIVFDEYLVEYAVDRVDTTFTVWQGITMGCCRCHDHKYDPFTQQDFYRLVAYFNNLPERGRVKKYGNSAPTIKAPTRRQQEELSRLKEQLSTAERVLQLWRPQGDADQRLWEASFSDDSLNEDWTITDRLAAHFRFNGDTADSIDTKRIGKSVGGQLKFDAAPVGKAVRLEDQQSIEYAPGPVFSGADEFTFSARFKADVASSGTVLSMMDDDDTRSKGFSIDLLDGKLLVQYGPRWLDDAIRIVTDQEFETGKWYHITLTYDGSQMASGLRLFVDGMITPTTVLLDVFTGTFSVEGYLLRIGSRGKNQNNFRGALTDVRYYTKELNPPEISVIACAESIGSIVKQRPNRRSRVQTAKLSEYFLRVAGPKPLREAYLSYQRLSDSTKQLVNELPTAMVMQDRDQPRDTFVLIRGQYDRTGKKVSCGTPASLPISPVEGKDDRLALARWLVSPANPLTARVTVNRYWQTFFGTGIVRTTEDFGSQGDRPSHPQLLDWLATEFISSGWDVKHIHRLIVTSATYKQSSRVTRDQLRRDPTNRLLVRGPRLRLAAETIRDQALAVSGLLHGSIGGPSVKPYQPEGLWKEIASDTYHQDEGSALYRRGMYTFWKRTVPPPVMATFDATSREACTVRRSRTNTPLQALALMNEQTFVEAARHLGQRMLTEGGDSDEQRLAYGFRLVTARLPGAREAAILLAGLKRHRDHYREDPIAARRLVAVGPTPPNTALPATDLAAYTAVANTLLNLDETVTRE